MSESIYFYEFEVAMKDCNFSQQLKVTSLIDCLQDAAWYNAAALGFNTTDLLKHGHTWVLNRMKVTFRKMPVYGEKFTIETWPADMNKYSTQRDFRVWSSKKELLAEATSNWLVMNVEQRKLIQIPAYIQEGRFTVDRNNMTTFKGKVKFDEGNGSTNRKINVSLYDLDINDHVNNTKLFQWVLDGLPPDDVKKSAIKSIDLTFKHEVNLEHEIASQAYWDEDKKVYLHRLFEQQTDQVFVVAETTLSS